VAAPLPGPDLPADVRPLLESLTGRDDDLDDRIFDGGRIDRLTAAVFARRLTSARARPTSG
jgi:hypothetical protein